MHGFSLFSFNRGLRLADAFLREREERLPDGSGGRGGEGLYIMGTATQAKGGMTCRTTDVITICQYSRVTEAARRMHELRIGCLVVVADDGDDTMVGIISERDILNWIGSATPETYMQRICAVMTRNVVTGTPEMSLADARDLMLDHGIRHLPVVDNGVAVGMVSLRDVLARAEAPPAASA